KLRIVAVEARQIQRYELSMCFRPRSGVANDSGKRRAVRRGDQHEIETHMLAKFAQLVFYSSACRVTMRIVEQQLCSSLKCGVFACDLEEPAVLKIAFGADAGDGYLALIQGCAEPITHGRLHEPLNHPETARQKRRERDEADQERASLKSRCHLDGPT